MRLHFGFVQEALNNVTAIANGCALHRQYVPSHRIEERARARGSNGGNEGDGLHRSASSCSSSMRVSTSPPRAWRGDASTVTTVSSRSGPSWVCATCPRCTAPARARGDVADAAVPHLDPAAVGRPAVQVCARSLAARRHVSAARRRSVVHFVQWPLCVSTRCRPRWSKAQHFEVEYES